MLAEQLVGDPQLSAQMDGGCRCLPSEMDMDDMFWEIHTRKVFQALKWATERVRSGTTT